MKSWQEFRQAEPLLQRIERRFTQLQEFENKHKEELENDSSQFSADDIFTAKKALLESIKAEAENLPGKVYYWLYPFYEGNFLQLVAALGSCGVMDKQKDDPESRSAFYRFFRTVPMKERLMLGQKLEQPELTEQAIRIQRKIQAKRAAVRTHINKHHSN